MNEIIWTEPSINIIESFKGNHNIIKATLIQAENLPYLYLILYDDTNYKREVVFTFETEVPNVQWLLNGRPAPTEPTQFDLSIDNILTYDDFKGFNVTGRVTTTDNAASPIEGAFVQYVENYAGTPVTGAYAYTAANGTFTINDIPIDYIPGLLTVIKDGYSITDSEYISSATAGQTVTVPDIQMRELTEASFVITGAEHHSHFKEKLVIESDVIFEENLDAIDKLTFSLGSTYSINEDGVLSIRYPEEEIEIDDYSYTIEPFAEEGFVVDKWNVNGSNLEVGETYTITSIDEINCLVTYKSTEPSPAPEPEIISSAAQTGDETSAIVATFLLIFMLSATITTKKLLSN